MSSRRRRAHDSADFDVSNEPGFRRYIEAVSASVGADLEHVHFTFCAEGAEGPASEAYIAVPRLRDAFPGREVALLWVPSGGWQLAVETSSTEDMIVLGSTTGSPVPQPSAVRALCEDYLHPSPR
ncbi:DUF6292 family protein [Rhodococcus maanshanensis]|uniref:DUF6292 domain-containing protein n=1 Tax=Rhodococcus maanshanensis TaxID=183556 RepID=A0A1H7LM92_9NOCA|nr:DUF6292 family protein [Rhodococcus maanshanensis]SEL00073.1 hypothetical protein SAMN05444583_10596 [Rhodococcus maanshanensis]